MRWPSARPQRTHRGDHDMVSRTRTYCPLTRPTHASPPAKPLANTSFATPQVRSETTPVGARSETIPTLACPLGMAEMGKSFYISRQEARRRSNRTPCPAPAKPTHTKRPAELRCPLSTSDASPARRNSSATARTRRAPLARRAAPLPLVVVCHTHKVSDISRLSARRLHMRATCRPPAAALLSDQPHPPARPLPPHTDRKPIHPPRMLQLRPRSWWEADSSPQGLRNRRSPPRLDPDAPCADHLQVPSPRRKSLATSVTP